MKFGERLEHRSTDKNPLGEKCFVTGRYSVKNTLYTDTGHYFSKDLLLVPALNY